MLDEHGFSEAKLRRAYGRARNADIAAHIIGFVRQAALGDPLVPYETRVEFGPDPDRDVENLDGEAKAVAAPHRPGAEGSAGRRPGNPGEPAFASPGGFDTVDRRIRASTCSDVLTDLNKPSGAAPASRSIGAHMNPSADLVNRLWRLCAVLRKDGITYQQYVTELTYLLFLKMMAEQKREDGRIPARYRWGDLKSPSEPDRLQLYRRSSTI